MPINSPLLVPTLSGHIVTSGINRFTVSGCIIWHPHLRNKQGQVCSHLVRNTHDTPLIQLFSTPGQRAYIGKMPPSARMVKPTARSKSDASNAGAATPVPAPAPPPPEPLPAPVPALRVQGSIPTKQF